MDIINNVVKSNFKGIKNFFFFFFFFNFQTILQPEKQIMSVIIPPVLRKGNKVGIVSTARKITLEEIQPAIELLQGWGFEVVIGNTIGKQHLQFAGTEEERIADMQCMLDDDSIR